MANSIPWQQIAGIVLEAYDEWKEEGSTEDPESPGEVTIQEYVEIMAHALLKGVEAFGEGVE